MNKVSPKRLGDLITLKRGYDLPAKDRGSGPYPVFSSAGVSGFHNEYKVEGQGVVTGRYGTLGEMYFVEDKYWPHNTALYVQDFKGNDPKYIYYRVVSSDLTPEENLKNIVEATLLNTLENIQETSEYNQIKKSILKRKIRKILMVCQIILIFLLILTMYMN